MSTQHTLAKCGVRFNPPAIIITYKVNLTGKMHRRTMPLRNFNRNSGIARVAEELRGNSRHKKFLEHIPLVQLEKLIALIKDKLNGMSLEDSLKKTEKNASVDPDEDLNFVEEEVLKLKKASMDQDFEKNRKKPGDDDFQYDVEMDFDGAIETCGWDSGDDDDEF